MQVFYVRSRHIFQAAYKRAKVAKFLFYDSLVLSHANVILLAAHFNKLFANYFCNGKKTASRKILHHHNEQQRERSALSRLCFSLFVCFINSKQLMK